jgi:uncharacterized membrane protein
MIALSIGQPVRWIWRLRGFSSFLGLAVTVALVVGLLSIAWFINGTPFNWQSGAKALAITAIASLEFLVGELWGKALGTRSNTA